MEILKLLQKCLFEVAHIISIEIIVPIYTIFLWVRQLWVSSNEWSISDSLLNFLIILLIIECFYNRLLLSFWT